MTILSTLEMVDFTVSIKKTEILKKINLRIEKNKITCIIGPSGGGKSTLIRSINRINDSVSEIYSDGTILFDSVSIHNKSVDPVELRSKIGMVFQKPCIFPKSIKENVLFGIQRLKKLSKAEKREIVEDQLKAVSLWEEVCHRLDEKATTLSIGQQQRLCIARTLATSPTVLLLDEPTSSLDPISTIAIEKMILALKEKYTIVFVTHNLQQAKRIADKLVFIQNGEIIEQGGANVLFSQPKQELTKAYLKGFLELIV